MSADDKGGYDYSLTPRTVVARRQLHASIGAIAAIALVATAIVVSIKVSVAPEKVAATGLPRPAVKASVRQVPSQTLQATDRAKTDRGG